MPMKPLPDVAHALGPVEAGEVAATDLVVAMREHLGLPAEPSPRRDLPEHVPADFAARVDLRALIAWMALGLWLLAGRFSLGRMLAEVRIVLATAAMRRTGGNRTRAETAIRLNRRRLTQLTGMDRLAPVGTRVIAIESIGSDTVYAYGYGRYDGTVRPPNGTRTRLGLVTELWPAQFAVPRLVLDDGRVVWGPQCWWLTEAELSAAHGEKAVVFVPPP